MDITFRASGYIRAEFRIIKNSADESVEWKFAVLRLVSDKGTITFHSFYESETQKTAGFTIDQLRAIAEAFNENITSTPPIDDEIPF